MILTVALLFIILKKELAELGWVSLVLFVALGLFILMNFVQLVFDKRFERATFEKSFWEPQIKYDTIGALSVMMVAYGY